MNKAASNEQLKLFANLVSSLAAAFISVGFYWANVRVLLRTRCCQHRSFADRDRDRDLRGYEHRSTFGWAGNP